ncbi:MAG: hypothetical protein EBT13_18650 [Rhodobacteraceae bacterium]|nr:hypothetical protein [Paracoccaceae bacterium]
MSARETIERMQATIDQQRAKIARMEAGRHKQDIREGKLSARIAELQQDVAALEAANDRLVNDLLKARAAARPLLTEAEDEAGTKRMTEIELRGQIW